MVTVKAVIFDLDDTLYLEREYVESGFRYVAANVSATCDLSIATVFEFLWNRFEQGHRGDHFNRFLEAHTGARKHWTVPALVDLYRSHSPAIRLMPRVSELISDLAATGAKIGLITDGPIISQSAKLSALGVLGRFDVCILNDTWGTQFRKPHRRGYDEVAACLGLQGGDLVYVADNPEKDFLSPRQMGWRTVRLRIPQQLRYSMEPISPYFAADCDLDSVDELAHYLQSLT